ncbi:MAG: CehA/McbA family metallohydrolase [Phycisphaerae bacterium]|nr:CehA/McbA family metallohydrolase [Phycisphaerae bacterium]
MVSSDNIYFGHFHNHTELSGATGTPAQAYSAARSAGLDFFGLSDHGEALTTDEFVAMQTAADASNAAGAFSAFWGFEWSSSKYGHITVVHPATFASAGNASTDTFSEFMSWLGAQGAVAFFNHPGRQNGAGTEFEHFTGAYSDNIVGMELWNKGDSFGTYYYNEGYTSDTRDRSGHYDEALLEGWQIGAAGSRDNHDGTWGSGSYRLAILAGSNTRGDLYSALWARRFYSTLDQDLELSFRVNGSEMGSTIAGGISQCVIEAADRGNEGFSRIEVIHNGYIVYTQSVAGQTHPLVTCDLFAQQGDTLYCKVTQSDGDEAISSPVFITSNGPDGPPRSALTAPLDNGPDDLEPASGQVTVNMTQPAFQIQLSDLEGVNDSTVTSAAVSVAGLTLGADYTFAYNGSTDVITLAPLSDGFFGNGTYAITLSGISDVAGYTMTAKTLTILIDTSIVVPQTLRFQEGVDGYSGTVDTMICAGTSDTSYGDSTSLNVDTSDTYGGASQVLLRFDSITGGAADQIPPYASISSATLRLRSLDTGNGGSLHAMLQPWSDVSTWNSLVNGILADDVESSSAAEDSISANIVGDVDLDVTATVQGWVDGTIQNNGWAVLPNGTDGWHIASAEHGTTGYRPELSVTFVESEAMDTAHNPSPANGASAVPMSVSLQWTPGTGALCHDVYLWTGGTPVLVSGRQPGTTYAPPQPLAGETAYSWRIDEYYRTDPGEIPVMGDVWTFTTGPATVVSRAVSESPVKGVVGGTYAHTHSSDDVYETITEVPSAPNKNAYSMLEHVWRFDVAAGTYIEFSIEASRSASSDGDNFEFSYSTDGTTYHTLLTVASTMDTVQSSVLPSGTAGTVYVKATDTNHARGYANADVLSIDFMCIISSQVPIPQPPVANAGPDQTVADSDKDGVESLTLNGSGSDPEGSEVTFQWSVDGDMILGATDASLVYGFTPGTHTATLEVTDGDGLIGSDDATIIVQAAGASMHVAGLDGVASVKGSSGQWTARVTVTVADQAGAPVSGATVTGAWGGAASGDGTGVTGSDGTVTISSSNMRSGASVTFTVNHIAHSSLTYQPADNIETSITVTYASAAKP